MHLLVWQGCTTTQSHPDPGGCHVLLKHIYLRAQPVSSVWQCDVHFPMSDAILTACLQFTWLIHHTVGDVVLDKFFLT